MRSSPSVCARFAACGFLLLPLLACSSAQEPLPPEQAARVGDLHTAGLGTPLLLHPIRVLGRADVRVAQALGLVLERQGMSALDVAQAPFEVAADTAWDDVPAAFAAHVQMHPVEGAKPSYHLYGEFLGTPKTGPQEVRFVVVDARGQVVLTDRQTPADRAFRRTAGRDPDPMGCSVLVGDRLFTLADWKPQPDAVPDGKFARLWRELSGAPDPREVEAMKPRLAKLREGIHSARIAVLPSIVPGGHDAGSSQRLADGIARELGCKAAPAKDGAEIVVKPDRNEQKRLWDLARGAHAAAAAEAANADYVLVADLGVGGDGGVMWVHVVVCNAAGEPVVVDMQNDQHPALRRAAPKTVADAEAFAVARLATLLR